MVYFSVVCGCNESKYLFEVYIGKGVVIQRQGFSIPYLLCLDLDWRFDWVESILKVIDHVLCSL